MKAVDITTHLEGYYKSSRYVVPNIYLFDHPYKETDLLVVKDNGYTYDIEVKVSRSDFKADFKKVDKHSILENGYYKMKKGGIRTINGKRKRLKAGDKVPSERPNRFYFAVPEGLVTKKEVPKYAGLLYITKSGVVKKIKEAPSLHKKKLDVEPRLCRKFYFYWLNCKNK
jgi:hypothetical protein